MRVLAGVAATLVLLCSYAAAPADGRVVAVTVVVGVVVVIALVLWSEGAVTFGAAGLAAAYVTALHLGHVVADISVPVVGGLLVVYLDAADLALAVPPERPIDRVFLRAVVRRMAGRAAVGVVAAAGVIAVASLPTSSPAWLRIAGMAGAILALSAPLTLLRRR